MNLIAREIFQLKSGLSGTNTEIGGVSSVLYNAQLLATKLAIDVSRITNFAIVGTDIKCRIAGSYAIPGSSFFWQTLPCTYYKDDEYLVNLISGQAFYNTPAFDNTIASFRNATSVGDQSFAATKGNAYLLKNAVNISQKAFSNCFYSNIFYIPNCIDLGGSALYNEVFQSISFGTKIYAHPSLATNNAGGVDGDLAYAIGRGAIVNYVTNETAPNAITDLSIGIIYATAIQLNFTPSSGTNTIDYYECYANGVLKNKIFTTGEYITGLIASTFYNITIVAVDVFFNKSVVSNGVPQLTNSANAMPTAGLKSYYKLNETSGATANDAYGTEHLTNTGVSINQSGKIGAAYKTTGAGQKLDTSSASPITGNFTLNCWVFSAAAQSTYYTTTFEYGSYISNTGFGFLLDTGSPVGLSWRINQNYNHYNQTFPVNQWNMITMVYNGTNVKVYINSVLTSITAQTINPTTSAFKTLFYRQGETQQFIGSVDEASSYNVALTQNQIDIIYNLGTGITL
jgi:hypothetical protein